MGPLPHKMKSGKTVREEKNKSKPTLQEKGEVNQRISHTSGETVGMLRIAVSQMGCKAFSAIQLNLRAARTSQRPTSACSQVSFIAGCGCSFWVLLLTTSFASSPFENGLAAHFPLSQTLVRRAQLGISSWVQVPGWQGLTSHHYRVLQ